MRFICTDFTDNTTELYHQSPTNQSVVAENNYLYYKSHYVNDSNSGTIYYYLNDTVRKMLLSSWNYDGVAETPATWLLNSGLTGTDHTAYSNTFDWNAKAAMQLRSGYFYTILADDGLHFCKPQRISTSKQISTFTVLSEIDTYESTFSFEGETGQKFLVSDEKETVTPISIDSTMKTARLNKYKSMQNVITFQSGYDASPLDYIFRNGYYYIVVSKATVKTDLYVYTAVAEQTGTYSFSGSTLTPFKAQSSLLWGNVYAWVNFVGTGSSGSATIRGSYNVTSVTINATGDFKINFTNAISDSNYCVSGMAMRDSNNILVVSIKGDATYGTYVKTTDVTVQTRDNANNLVAATAVTVLIIR